MKLTYWLCEHLSDSACYSIRAKTRKEAEKLRDEQGWNRYDKAKKITVEYVSAFDLICLALGEGGIEH